MKVLKFGGTSLGSPELITRVADIVESAQNAKPGIVVVFSAFSGITNHLIVAGKRAETGDTNYNEEIEIIKEKHCHYISELFADEETISNVTAKINSLITEIEEITHGMFLLKELSPKSIVPLFSFASLGCFHFETGNIFYLLSTFLLDTTCSCFQQKRGSDKPTLYNQHKQQTDKMNATSYFHPSIILHCINLTALVTFEMKI